VQWIASERLRRSVTPRAFWWMSVAGSCCLAAYSLHAGELTLLLGNAVNGAIFARNLRLEGRLARRVPPRLLPALAAAALVALLAPALGSASGSDGQVRAWLAVVTVGQALWSSRFVVQWWHAERVGRAQLPPAFWWISLAGNGLLLAYALHLGDAVYVAGFLPGPLVQVRNLLLLRRQPPALVGRA
jgi:lipid-A-disaccharide synthase-like uncharacterized protein